MAQNLTSDRNRKRPRVDTLIVGLGNELLSDDGVGIHVARRLRDLVPPDRCDIVELCVGGIDLVERMLGYRRVVVIDACRTGRRPPGTLRHHRPEEFLTSLRTASYHTVDFPSAIELVRQLGGRLPDKITVFSVEAEDIETVRERCTPRVAAAIKAAAIEIAWRLETERTGSAVTMGPTSANPRES